MATLSLVLALAAAGAEKREFIVRHADRFLYERANRVTRLIGNVEIEHEGFTLTSRAATYREELEVIEFEGDVRAVEPGRVLTARRLIYHVPDSLAVASGDVLLVDDDRSITIRGDSLHHERPTGVYRMAGKPVFRKQARQSIRIRCRRMTYDTAAEAAEFVSDVKIEADSLTILCQGCRYWDRDGRLEIEGDPLAFDSRNILSGQRMEVGLEEEEIRWVKVIDGAEGLCLEGGAGTTGRAGQSWVKGDTLIMHLTESRIDRMDVIGNAESFYRPGGAQREDAVNRAIGNRIVLDFLDGEIARVFVREHTEGTYLQAGTSNRSE